MQIQLLLEFASRMSQMQWWYRYEYTEKIVTKDISLPELFEELGKQVRTIPQIVIDKKHIGGYNELKEYFADQGKINFKGETLWYNQKQIKHSRKVKSL